MRDPLAKANRCFPLIFVAGTVLAYAPVFGADFLNYDDPWLFQRNPMLEPTSWDTPRRAFLDFSRETRLALGAEYLPLRDLLVWVETRVWGLSAAPMHLVSLGLYIATVMLLRGSLRITLAVMGPGVELTLILFALHPIHAESVAWLSGQKDVLAMFFVASALYAHAKACRYARLSVPLCVFAACGSKAMSVAVIGLLVAQDFMLRRKLDWATYASSALLAAFVLALQLQTGRVVGMLSAPAGGSYQTALMTMGPVVLRYVRHCVFPTDLSITYMVETATSWSVLSVAGYGFALLTLLLSILAVRRRERLWLFAWAWFFVPLLPVSQFWAALQNRMADRYAFLSVLGPCVVLSSMLCGGWSRARHWTIRCLVLAVAIAAPIALGSLTFQRSLLFTDGVLLFFDATEKDPTLAKPAYHLGRTLAEAGRTREAELAFRETLRRTRHGIVTDHRRAANSLAKLLAERGAVHEALGVLEQAVASFPTDPTLLGNMRILREALQRGGGASPLAPAPFTPAERDGPP